MNLLWQLERLRINNAMEKDKKKKTLTISSNLKKKIDTRAFKSIWKKIFFCRKKKIIQI